MSLLSSSGQRGIRVNAVAPGLVRTGTTEPLWGIPGMVEAYTENTAIGHYGRPGDIAAAVTFLASEISAYISGTTLLVDGGAHHLAYPDTRNVRARAAEAALTVSDGRSGGGLVIEGLFPREDGAVHETAAAAAYGSTRCIVPVLSQITGSPSSH